MYRGANALRFGSGTLGGAINGITPTGRTASGVYARLDTGSNNSYRTLISGGAVMGAGDIWAAVSSDSSEGDRDHAKRDSRRFHGNIGLKLSETVRTRFYASVNNIDQDIPGALTLTQAVTMPRIANPSNLVGDNARDIDSLRLQNRTSFDFGKAKLDIGVFLNAKSLYHPIFQVVDQESVDKGFFARLDYEGEMVSATIGGETRFGEVASKRFVNLNGKRGARTFAADQDARTSNIYGEFRLRPVDWISLIAGGIYADGSRKQHQTFNSFAGGVTDVRAKAKFTEFSPKFGVLIDASPQIQFYGNYSRSAEFPGFVELAQISSFVPVSAQSAWTAEIGSRGKAGIIGWDVSVYQANLKNELLQFTVDATTPASTFNANKTLHQGVEAALTITPTDWLRLRQVYQYSDFRLRGNAQYGNNRLPVIPRHAYRVELRIGGDSLHIAPHAEWVPQGPFADYSNTVRTKGYALIGITGGAKVTNNVDIFLDVRNITNKKAVGDISAVIAATNGSQIYYPVERRSFFGGVRTRF